MVPKTLHYEYDFYFKCLNRKTVHLNNVMLQQVLKIIHISYIQVIKCYKPSRLIYLRWACVINHLNIHTINMYGLEKK